MSKECFFKQNNVTHIDYKDVSVLKKFVNPNGRMISPRRSGVKLMICISKSLGALRRGFLYLKKNLV
jgi:hypothetical protein